jgi:hypothetical protein
MNKTTTERIEEILKEIGLVDDIDREVIKLQLEALVIQAQLEQLESKK